MLYYILLAIYLVTFGVFMSWAFASNLPRTDIPPIYRSKDFLSLINLSIYPLVILFVFLMYLDWKTTLIITVIVVFVGPWTLKPFAERLIIIPLYKKLQCKGKGEDGG
jgi:hypothetical protein